MTEQRDNLNTENRILHAQSSSNPFDSSFFLSEQLIQARGDLERMGNEVCLRTHRVPAECHNAMQTHSIVA